MCYRTQSIAASAVCSVKAMIKSIDQFFNRTRTKTYNCLDFVREVWLAMTGEDITDRLVRLQGAFSERKATHTGMKGFTRLETPVSPCFVVMQCRGFEPHVGIYLDRRIFHLGGRGVEYQPLEVARVYFRQIRYYR